MTGPFGAVLQAVREKAEAMNGGASLGTLGDFAAEWACLRAMAWCQRGDIPPDMEFGVAALALALWKTLPQGGAEVPDSKEDGEAGEPGQRNPAEAGAMAEDWEALLSSGAVKSIQRGDTAITFASGGSAAASSALNGCTGPAGVEEALAGLAPWRKLGRLKRRERRGADG